MLKKNELEIKQLFIRFLKENNCYKQYIIYSNDNAITYISWICYDDNFNIYVKRNYRGLINCFNWNRTTEGRNFWLNLHIKWNNILTEFII